MKIGILTQPLQNNYGGLLQNFALQYVLKQHGHNVVTLDWASTTPKWHELLYQLKCHVLHFVKKTPLPAYKLTKKEKEIIERNTREFIEKYINRTTQLRGDGFRNYLIKNDIEAVIVGSDQCWRPMFNNGMLEHVFLDFTKGLSVKRIAYAASFGVDNWEYTEEQTRTCSDLIRFFDLVTVRENSAVPLCKNYLNTDAYHVLDPTMLLDKQVYIELIKKEKVSQCRGKLFYYILDPAPEKASFVDVIGKSHDIRKFTVLPQYQTENRTKENVKNEIEKCIFPGVCDWLRGFLDCEMVVCDSFHGCVFSIIFNKPFWVISNKNRGNSRFNSLLSLFGLEDRLLDVDELDKVDINMPIDWVKVNERKQTLKVYSEELLLKHLNSVDVK